MVSCKKDGFILHVNTYTPQSWGSGFYYGTLGGPSSDRKVKIDTVLLSFPDTGDQLLLDNVREERTYVFRSVNMDEILDRNKKLKLTLHLTDEFTGISDTVEYLLERNKQTYSTGTWMH